MGLDHEGLDPDYSILENIVKRRFPFQGGTLRGIGVQTNVEDVSRTLEQRLALIDQ